MRTSTAKLTGTGRAAVVLAALVASLTGPGATSAVADIRSDDFPAALLALAQVLTLATACWVLVVVVAGAARLPTPGVPASLRAALFTTVVVAASASPALADSPHDLSGLTLPDRPVAVSVSTVATPHAVQVRAGDTIWAIAANHLPAQATDTSIARATARWYASNRHVIGPDPDLIVPGQTLQPPATEQDAS